MDFRKEKSANETCAEILELLKKNNIKIKIKFHNFNKMFYSCRVQLKDYNLGTNGKGVTREAALASGLAEFMERLQGFKLIRPSFCGKKIDYFNVIHVASFDEINLFKSQNIMGLTKEKLDLICDDLSYSKFTDYIDIFTKEKVTLPYFLINNLCETNGYCAGNTREEAVSQGICEILERYCIRENLKNYENIPNIPIEALSNLQAYQYIKNIQKMGYYVVVKDFTLKGQFPVVAVLVSLENKYIFSAGCDPDLNIALQRCLTEVFQGLNNKNFIKKFQEFTDKEIDYLNNSYLMFINNKAILSKDIQRGENVNLGCLPFCEVQNSQECLEYLCKLLQNKNLKLFIKNYNFLGFPTYHIYTPTLSEIHDVKSFDFSSKTKISLNKYFFNLDNLSTNELCEFDNLLDSIKLTRAGNYFGSDCMFDSKINNLNMQGIKALIKYKQGKGNNKYNNYFSSIVAPTSENCDECKIKHHCYYKIWYKYFNLLNTKFKNLL